MFLVGYTCLLFPPPFSRKSSTARPTRHTREIGGAVVCSAEVMLALDEDQVVEIARSVLASGRDEAAAEVVRRALVRAQERRSGPRLVDNLSVAVATIF